MSIIVNMIKLVAILNELIKDGIGIAIVMYL